MDNNALEYKLLFYSILFMIASVPGCFVGVPLYVTFLSYLLMSIGLVFAIIAVIDVWRKEQ